MRVLAGDIFREIWLPSLDVGACWCVCVCVGIYDRINVNERGSRLVCGKERTILDTCARFFLVFFLRVCMFVCMIAIKRA